MKKTLFGLAALVLFVTSFMSKDAAAQTHYASISGYVSKFNFNPNGLHEITLTSTPTGGMKVGYVVWGPTLEDNDALMAMRMAEIAYANQLMISFGGIVTRMPDDLYSMGQIKQLTVNGYKPPPAEFYEDKASEAKEAITASRFSVTGRILAVGFASIMSSLQIAVEDERGRMRLLYMRVDPGLNYYKELGSLAESLINTNKLLQINGTGEISNGTLFVSSVNLVVIINEHQSIVVPQASAVKRLK